MLNITGPGHGGNSCSTSPGRCLGEQHQLSITGPRHSDNTNSTLPGRYHGNNISSASPNLCLGIRISSTSPGLATVITPCTGGVLRLPSASLWRRFPARAGRFQSSTFGDSAPLRSLAIMLAVGSAQSDWGDRIGCKHLTSAKSGYGIANRLRLVQRIAPARRSCLVQSKGQPSATMVGIDGVLGKSSPFQVHRSFSMLIWCESTMR
jgi:hypothetical protein